MNAITKPPRELLKAWLDLSENRCLSVETYSDRRASLWSDTVFTGVPDDHRLLARWRDLDSEIVNGWRDHPLTTLDPDALEKYWSARHSLERETREYLERTEDECG